MQKLILMSVIFFPLIFSIRASSDSNAARGLKRTVIASLVFTALWALIAPWIVSFDSN
jgi:hypothetical protein